jgi:hypothetical protein
MSRREEPSMMKTVRRSAAVLIIALSGLVMVPQSPASADFGCPGDRDSWRPYKNSAGTTAAVLQQYDTADGVCISLVSKNQYFGVSKYMRIRVCHFKFPAQEWACATDEGSFREYAGPIYKSDNCVRVRSTMKDPFNGDTIMDHIVYMGACN